MFTIGLIEQDKALGDAMEKILEETGYVVIRADSLPDAKELFHQVTVDMMILDLEQKEFAGAEETAGQWEEVFLTMLEHKPLLLIRLKDPLYEKRKKCIERADDYIRKPFDMQEFRIRVEVRLRKIPEVKEKISHCHYGEITLDTEKRMAAVNGLTAKLTRTESAILKCLMQHGGRMVAKPVLLKEIADDTPDGVENSIKVHVSNLRRKLRELSGKDYIETRRGMGIRLR